MVNVRYRVNLFSFVIRQMRIASHGNTSLRSWSTSRYQIGRGVALRLRTQGLACRSMSSHIDRAARVFGGLVTYRTHPFPL